MRDQEASVFQASVNITLTPINKYGDTLHDAGELAYKINLRGPLSEIVGKLEALKNG